MLIILYVAYSCNISSILVFLMIIILLCVVLCYNKLLANCKKMGSELFSLILLNLSNDIMRYKLNGCHKGG